MSDEKHAFSIEMKSKKHLISLAIDCDQRMEGVFIEGFLGELLDVKLVEDALLEISGTNGTFRLDINRKELTRALTKKPRRKESGRTQTEGL